MEKWIHGLEVCYWAIATSIIILIGVLVILGLRPTDKKWIIYVFYIAGLISAPLTLAISGLEIMINDYAGFVFHFICSLIWLKCLQRVYPYLKKRANES